MKKMTLFVYLIPLTIFLNLSCEEQAGIVEKPIIEPPIEIEEPPIESDENGNIAVIGVDPCGPLQVGTEAPRRAFVVRLISTSDTVVTYNLPLKLARQLENSIKSMPLYDGTLFPQEKIFKIKLSYRFATEEERRFSICPANISTWLISKFVHRQIIILPENAAE